MSTTVSISGEDRIVAIGVANGEDDYLLWQARSSNSDEIHFEWNDQSNGGYDQVRELTIMPDGMHIVLNDGQLHHFYFNGLSADKYQRLVAALGTLHEGKQDISEVLDCRSGILASQSLNHSIYVACLTETQGHGEWIGTTRKPRSFDDCSRV